MSTQTLTESGEWRDGRAAPKLIAENLRKLPSEIVGTDVDYPDKAHEVDAPHVVKSIVKDFGKKMSADPKDDTPEKIAKRLWAPGPGERAPVRQWFVDVVKMRVISTLINRAIDEYNAGFEPDVAPCHLWFPVNNANEYMLRRGNPPPRKERPRHLRDIDLTVDITDPPRSVVEELKKRGVELDIKKTLKEIDDGRRLIHLV